MKVIEEMILKSVYGISALTEKEITLIEDDLDVFVHQARLERGKEPSGEEMRSFRKRSAEKFEKTK